MIIMIIISVSYQSVSHQSVSHQSVSSLLFCTPQVRQSVIIVRHCGPLCISSFVELFCIGLTASEGKIKVHSSDA